MNEMSLSTINNRLAQARIPVVLTPETAARIKAIASRDRVMEAVTRASQEPGERTWLMGLMRRAGLKLAVENNNESPGPVSTAVPAAATAAKPSAPVPSKATAPAPAPAAKPDVPTQHKSAAQTPTPREGGTDTADADRLSVHVYGGKAALSFEADKTRDGTHTVALDAAVSVGERKYDWTNKIRLQLTSRELPVVAAVMLGLVPKCEFKNHGPNNDKGFSMECQIDKVFVKVFAKDQALRAVPVDAADAWRVGTVLLRQLRRQCPWMDGQALNLSLRALATRIAPRGGAQ